METIGAYEAKTYLPRLLEKAARGETIVITKHGRPVARLVPAPDLRCRSVAETIEALREFRKGNRLDGLTIRELIEEGRTR
jgi:prevent-host-death family protein